MFSTFIRFLLCTVGLLAGASALIYGPSSARAEDRIGEAACATLTDSTLADRCWTRLVKEQCEPGSHVPDRDACVADLSAKRHDPSLVRLDNLELRDGLMVMTKPLGSGDIYLSVAVPAGPGSDVPPTHSAILMMTCSAGELGTVLGLSRPATSSVVDVFLNDQPFDTDAWTQSGDSLAIQGDGSARLIAALRGSDTARFIARVGDNEPYQLAFNLSGVDSALWSFEYLCP